MITYVKEASPLSPSTRIRQKNVYVTVNEAKNHQKEVSKLKLRSEHIYVVMFNFKAIFEQQFVKNYRFEN